MDKQEELQELWWTTVDKVREVEDDNFTLIKIFWRKSQNKNWEFINFSQFGSTFHKSFGRVGGQYKISGKEFRDNDLANIYWNKQIKKIDKTFKEDCEFPTLTVKVFSEDCDKLQNKLQIILCCFSLIITVEGFANIDELIVDYNSDTKKTDYEFHLMTCDKNLLIKRFAEIERLLPVGFKIYDTSNYTRYLKRYKKEPRILFEKCQHTTRGLAQAGV